MRYFIEVAYKGTHFSGFQVQQNSTTIQSELEKALQTLTRQAVALTGSSRTDSGVHAYQNYFHFDFEESLHEQLVYKLNALLPDDIVVRSLKKMPAMAHSRFDAISRAYTYRIYQEKNPFLKELAYYYPYKIDLNLMNEAAAYIIGQSNFFAFAKTNTQVKSFECTILESSWRLDNGIYMYRVKGNRFLRGMVRLLTATMLAVGRGRLSLNEFKQLFKTNTEKCKLSVPPTGLFLTSVNYPENYFA